MKPPGSNSASDKQQKVEFFVSNWFPNSILRIETSIVSIVNGDAGVILLEAASLLITSEFEICNAILNVATTHS